MKKTPLIITIVIIAFMGLGFLLYKVSPAPVAALDLKGFNLSDVKEVKEPRQVGDDDHVLGNKDAKNTMVVFEDIQCPVCKEFEPTLKLLPEALKDTKVVFRHYPLYPRPHMNALAAAYASEAAAAQGKFWEFVSEMYEHQDEWANLPNPLDKMSEMAVLAGVSDIEKFKKDILESKYQEKIQNDYFEALGLNAGGTPSLYFNGKPVAWSNSLESIRAQAEKLYKE